ncbi:MAG: hypothetical protein KDA92_00600 [Planctomycetales bacterium]|nr:hypothetical protein [Planctomycetales bacterium]
MKYSAPADEGSEQMFTGRKWIIGALVVATIGGQLAAPANLQAGPILDWLFHRNRTPVVPVTTNYAPNTTGCCGAAYCEQTVLRYVPQVAYRTVWQPVPVTTYKRTVSYNPSTGLPITCTQPCQTYTYQARRVPYTTYRPVYTTEPLSPAPTATQPVSYLQPSSGVVPAAYVSPDTSSCGCSGGGSGATQWQPVPSSANQQPYYTSPNAASPGYSTPDYASPGYSTTPGTGNGAAGATPWEPVNPRTPTLRGDTRSGDPANERPRLDLSPDDSASRTLPSTRSQYADAGRTMPGNRGSNLNDFYRTPTEWTTVRPNYDELNESRTSATPPTASDSIMSRPRGTDAAESMWSDSSGRARRAPANVRPLPFLGRPYDTEASDTSESADDSAPPLINDPRSNTAAIVRPIPTRWASNQIQWPVHRVSYEEELTAEDESISRRIESTQRAGSTQRSAQSRRLDSYRVPVEAGSQSHSRVDSDQWRSRSATTRPLAPEQAGWQSRSRAGR